MMNQKIGEEKQNLSDQKKVLIEVESKNHNKLSIYRWYGIVVIIIWENWEVLLIIMVR